MLPETWLPTCTFTTGFSVPVAVTACVIGPRVIVAVWKLVAPPFRHRRTRKSKTISATMMSADRPKTFHAARDLTWVHHLNDRETCVRRYIEIYSIMLRNSLIREMSFKANFLLWMLVEVLWFVGQIVFFSIIFGNVDRIGDWTKWEVVLLIGTHQIIAQLFQAFFFVNVANIPELVRTGKLDSLLVLPIDSQFAVSTKQFGLDSIVNALLGGVVVCVSLSNSASCRVRCRSCST